MTPLPERLESALGSAVRSLTPLSGGDVAQVFEAHLADGRHGVVKVDEGGTPRLDVEARMLLSLRTVGLVPVPEVWHSAPDLLVMAFIENDGRSSRKTEEEAADLLAALHNVSSTSYGYEYDTLIGGLPQPNEPMPTWAPFFRDRRLLHMARLGYEAGRLPRELYARLQLFSEKIHRWLPKPNKPGLIHGDVWGGNVLIDRGKVAAFIDPALSFSDPEIELAFITLFNTFGERFFARYQEHRPLSEDFFEVRKDVYNLYPLLVHVRLFGGGYVASVDQILRRLGG